MEKVFKNPEGTAYLAKGYFTNPTLIDECVAYVKPLLEQKPEVIVFGKKCKQNRNVGFFSEESIGYKYSNNLMKSQPLGDKMSELLATVNNTVDSNFNGILVNEYKHGKDYIGDHSDDETGLTQAGVVSISYGEERIFRIKEKKTKKTVHDELTTHYGILQMCGNFQKLYTHGIPIQKKIKNPRISFTFRRHNR